MQGEQWLGIELRHLAALAAVARERSFRGAAARHRDRAHAPALREFVELAQEVARGLVAAEPALARSA